MSKVGDNSNVDMLVGDIYGIFILGKFIKSLLGGDYSKIGLKATTIASSFGKVIKVSPEERKKKFHQEDIARSLLYLVRYDFVRMVKSNNLVITLGKSHFLMLKLMALLGFIFPGFTYLDI